MPEPLLSAPEPTELGSCRLTLNPSVRHLPGGVLLGGTPLRVLRLSQAGGDALRELEAGQPAVGPRARLARQLVDAGLARADFQQTSFGLEDLTVVVPTRDRAEQVDQLLWRLSPARCLIVDDASAFPERLAQICAAHGASVVRSASPLGPGAARNLGASKVSTPLIAFIDSDVTCSAEDLGDLLSAFEDPKVAGVAPRVRGPRGERLLERFEHDASPLDMGTRRATVRPGTTVSYVPTACLILRQELCVGLFDGSLLVGEDVDALWRIAEAGWAVQYEPEVEVEHPVRPSLRAWLAQRHLYGRSAADLAQRHPEAIAPLRGSPQVLAGWAAAGLGYPSLGLGLVVSSTPQLATRLEPVSGRPGVLAMELTFRQGAESLPVVARQLLRSFAPALLGTALISKRARRALVGVVLLAGLGRWRSQRARLDPARFVALSTLDDLAYCSGLWRGAIEHRSLTALRPRVIKSD